MGRRAGGGPRARSWSARDPRDVRASAQRAGISRATLYRWKAVPGFAAKMADAELDYGDLPRAMVDERAKTSDAMLMMRAKSLLPEYKDVVRQEHVVPDGGLPVRFTLVIGDPPPEPDVAEPPDARVARVLGLALNGGAPATNGHGGLR